MNAPTPLHGVKCPECGHASLSASELGMIRCDLYACPRPDAAHLILATATPNHVVQVNPADFAIEHPLIERLDGVLLDTCPFGAWMNALTGPPVAPGRYNVIAQPEHYKGLPWRFERVPPVDVDGRTPHAPDAATVAADTEGVSA